METKSKRFIPICCVCENVRGDNRSPGGEPEWGPLHLFLQTHRLSSGDYHLTHTYCPACARQFTKLRKSNRAAAAQPQSLAPMVPPHHPELVGESTTA